MTRPERQMQHATIVVRADWDDEAQVWVATSDVYGPPPICKDNHVATETGLAVVYPALSRGDTWPQALMVFADRRPDKWTSS